MSQAGDNTVPVTVITGFLGSGKTTVLNHLLRLPELADTAVIINEFGEVSLDHLLIEQAIENAVLLKNGCICCTVRGDIADTIGELFRKRDTGELPWFARIAIETTGLADPAPVVNTLADLDQPCRLDGIVVTVDALHASKQLVERAEARQQIAYADRILLTKTDLATPTASGRVEQQIRALNVEALIHRVVDGNVTAAQVFGFAAELQTAPRRWLRPLHDHGDHHHHHHGGIGSTVLRSNIPISAASLKLFLDSLLSLRGDQVLRLKGIVQIENGTSPMVLQAVHHVLHDPVPLPPAAQAAWGSTGSEIVVIHDGLPNAGLQASFAMATGSVAGGVGDDR